MRPYRRHNRQFSASLLHSLHSFGPIKRGFAHQQTHSEKDSTHVISLLASEGGWQDFTLKGGEWLVLALSGAASLLALAVGFYLVKSVLAQDAGTEKMKEIAGAIQVGALAYLKRQFRTIGFILVPVRSEEHTSELQSH